MKSLLPLFFILSSFIAANAQETSVQMPDSINGQKVFTVVEKMAEFPGGESNLIKFLQKNIIYPAHARINNIKGTVYITFFVDTTGQLLNVRVLKSADPDLDAEALRIISIMPKWTPATINGHAVLAPYTLPIRFSLKQ